LVQPDYYSRVMGEDIDRGEREYMAEVDRYARSISDRDVIPFNESDSEYIQIMKNRRRTMREV
jgi:hypothetical protein